MKHIVIFLLFFVSYFVSPLGAEEKKAREIGIDGKVIREALVTGIGFGSYDHTGFPCSGNRELLEELGKVTLEGVEHFYVKDVQLKKLVNFIDVKIPSAGTWRIKVSDDARELKVTGFIDKNLMKSLVTLMQEGNVYCKVTDGLVEFRKAEILVMPSVKEVKIGGNVIREPKREVKSHGNAVVVVKPEYRRDPKEMAKGEAFMEGMPPNLARYGYLNNESYCYRGNSSLITMLKEVTLENIDGIAVKDVTLTELADIINSKIAPTNKFRIKVNDGAKELRVSGLLDKNLVGSLTRLMQHRGNFHCRVTDGLVEFKRGGNSLKLAPVSALPEGMTPRSSH